MFNFSGKLSFHEKAEFAKRLAFLIKANIPIVESLHILRDQCNSKSRIKMWDQIIVDVSNGQYLSTGLLKHRQIFGDFTINLIKIGEETGILHQNLEYLSEEFRKKYELKKKVVGALIYPLFIMAVTIGLIGVIALYVFPKVIPIFSSFGPNLPLATKILIASSNFAVNYWPYAGGVILLLGLVLTFLYKRVKVFNFYANKASFFVPIIGTLLKNYQLANFSRNMGLLINCNINIVSAANIAAESTTNPVYKKVMYELAEDITSGKKISQCLTMSPSLFPYMANHVISVGERTGNLYEAFMDLSKYYENEVDDLTKNLSNSLEPVLLIFMGLIVGLVAISVIAPIYEITKSIHA
ncbi:MAG: hypothetical protein A3B86_02925 [Candidatus Yanofskybacteria bacterium RIFCSPHIGHO2_02_FULL_38_22b]|uniref:Type II secretion system protein GspF domain-containing protein n=1 Tax=Candidatus Yanofskybacteria bacterium RIFCSPHIGHO2_02_FULL_38_22b TaxID=1802673 RepID=A0A1F8F130_9BACT|nr:MAG: hypothetical protein A2816_02515 [Candidatus Yanofskybacteria bacterium RIFCSPHIGHO2_01_FULL_39_44]OGN06825.1 MAG: hypothetical protein A3B86_02925 [Candidatus Yanofskybacteria bacterium RIFCSPHIGHO2_02_FULL_38_22b]OGN20720.1 MAG: hypothetical protein A2910_00885 [Candidatus Yanofskybacteria bacterium RIFCSPLOWO2_01_FULL_39_28]